jgi:hypothetical protein
MIDHFGGEVPVTAAEDRAGKIEPLPGRAHPRGSELADQHAIADIGMSAFRFHGHRMPLTTAGTVLASEFLNLIELSL